MIGIKVTTKLEVAKIKLESPHYEALRNELNGNFELVRPRGLKSSLCMMVDEEGLLKDLPANYVGCYLYETNKHGQPIVGDIIILGTTMTMDGLSISSLTDMEIVILENQLETIIEKIKTALRREET